MHTIYGYKFDQWTREKITHRHVRESSFEIGTGRGGETESIWNNLIKPIQWIIKIAFHSTICTSMHDNFLTPIISWMISFSGFLIDVSAGKNIFEDLFRLNGSFEISSF